jgi:hypothetical protein
MLLIYTATGNIPDSWLERVGKRWQLIFTSSLPGGAYIIDNADTCSGPHRGATQDPRPPPENSAKMGLGGIYNVMVGPTLKFAKIAKFTKVLFTSSLPGDERMRGSRHAVPVSRPRALGC